MLTQRQQWGRKVVEGWSALLFSALASHLQLNQALRHTTSQAPPQPHTPPHQHPIPPAPQQRLLLSQDTLRLCRPSLLRCRRITGSLGLICGRLCCHLAPLHCRLCIGQLLPQRPKLIFSPAALVTSCLQNSIRLCPCLCHKTLCHRVSARADTPLSLPQVCLGSCQARLRGSQLSLTLLQCCLALHGGRGGSGRNCWCSAELRTC